MDGHINGIKIETVMIAKLQTLTRLTRHGGQVT
jgi:hypothetical protein